MNRTSRQIMGSITLAICVLAVTSYIVLGQDGSRAISHERQTVIIHLSSGPNDVFASTLALRMAEEALDQRKSVILYLDHRGIRLAKRERTDQLRLGDEDPLWFMLDQLARSDGLEILICGESAYIQGLLPRDFMHYTFIAHSPGTVLSRVNRNTVVFSY